MPNQFHPYSVQSVLVEGISGPDGADRMYVTTGAVDIWMGGSTGETSWIGLLEPVLQPGQFRRAITTVTLMATGQSGVTSGVGPRISYAEADWDDESGKVELQFNTQGDVSRVGFHVMTFAAPPA
jgi:hypothetical protein